MLIECYIINLSDIYEIYTSIRYLDKQDSCPWYLRRYEPSILFSRYLRLSYLFLRILLHTYSKMPLHHQQAFTHPPTAFIFTHHPTTLTTHLCTIPFSDFSDVTHPAHLSIWPFYLICLTPPWHLETSRKAHAAAALFNEISTSCCAIYRTRI